jgi:uncharacterized protein
MLKALNRRNIGISVLATALGLGAFGGALVQNASLAQTTTQERATVARQFLSAMETENPEAMSTVLAENVVYEQVFQLPGNPSRFPNRMAAMAFFTRLFSTFSTIKFTDVSIRNEADSRWVILEMKGDFTVAANNAPYRNQYVAFAEIENGKIIRIREYFNPVVIANTFNLPIK